MAQATAQPPGGHDGPYDAPLILGPWTVRPDWIDYNGHMNVAYYTLAADQAIDAFLEDHLGIGASFVRAAGMGPYALQTGVHYLAEMLAGESFHVACHLLDHDDRRFHVCQRMIADNDGREAALFETVYMNVDLTVRRGAPYPDWAVARLARMRADHRVLPMPDRLGRPVGIRRKA